MSVYLDLSDDQADNFLKFLDLVWKTSPRVKSDAARYLAFEAAKAASLGLVTTWRGRVWGCRWLITARGLKLIDRSPRPRRRTRPHATAT
jgi:hypothetical protein